MSIDKEKLLKDLIAMKENDEKIKALYSDEFYRLEELYTLKGSIINLETLIEFIEEGKYDRQ